MSGNIHRLLIDAASCPDKDALFDVLETLLPLQARNFDALHDELTALCRRTRIDVMHTHTVSGRHIDVLLRVLADSASENAKLTVVLT